MILRPHSLPLADPGALWTAAPRTTLLRLGLALVIGALVAASVVVAAGPDRAAGGAAAAGTTVLVADFSSSISPEAYDRMAAVLRALARPDRRVGLVAFSDTAYEMLPPGTRGDELRPLVRYFGARRAGKLQAAEALVADTPWSGSFSSGTRISAGLRLARLAIERDRVRNATVVLLSDLEDPRPDLALVTREAARYRERGIRLRVVPLAAIPANRSLFFPLLAPAAAAIEAPEGPVRVEEPPSGRFPTSLVLVVAALLLVLAANEHLCRPLRWRRP